MFTVFKKYISTILSSTEDSKIDSPFLAYRNYANLGKKKPVCIAPLTSMSFNIDGTVSACCFNRRTSVSIQGKTIREVWESVEFKTLRKHVHNENLGYDCSVCLNKLSNEAFDGLKANDYHKFKPHQEYPRIMEFCLENTCNLACTMCNSVLSSSIRKEKGLAPSSSKYGDSFIAELREFIPYLDEAVFAGGEPFLIRRYFDIWEMMLSLKPDIKISIVSNGNVLNQKIKALLNRGQFHLNLSIDTFDKVRYENIRRNASFDKLMENLDWFIAYAKRKNTQIHIPVCPLRSNWETIPETVRIANNKNISLNFVYVERPFSMALVHAPAEFLAKIESSFKEEVFEVTNQNSIQNIKKFRDLAMSISDWKLQKQSSEIVAIDTERLMESWSAKYNHENASVKEIVLKISSIIPQLKGNNETVVLNMLSQLSSERLLELFKEKEEKEIKIIFEELIG